MEEYNKGRYSPREGDRTGNGASDLFLAMYVAPPGVYLERFNSLSLHGQSGQKTVLQFVSRKRVA